MAFLKRIWPHCELVCVCSNESSQIFTFFPALLGQKQATQPDLGNLMVVYEYTVHQGRTRWTHWSQIISEDILILFLKYLLFTNLQ